MRRPPRYVFFILCTILHDVDRDVVLGDLQETYSSLYDHYGRAEANRWYRSQVFRSAPFVLHRSIFWGLTMFRNYLRVAFRTIQKHKGYSFINVVGLAAGLSCFFFIALFVQHERTFDSFHENADQTYRVELNLGSPSGVTELATSPGALAPLLLESLSPVESATRIYRPTQITVRSETETYRETDLFFVDPSFDATFTLELLKGDLSGLARPNGAVLTAAASRKYFGDKNAVGQTVTVSDTLVIDITGIVRELPSNSHFRFSSLVSMSTFNRVMPNIDGRWSPHMFHTYARLAPGTDPMEEREGINRLVRENVELSSGWNLDFQLTPIQDIHLNSHRTAELDVNGSADALYIFGIVALFILAVACINFMNLSTARSSMRTREIGMRKVLGAQRGQLVGQFMGEAYLFCLLSVVLAIVIVVAGLPVFNTIAGTTFSTATLLQPPFILAVVGASIFVGLFAGSYPALLLSSFHPISVLKGWLSTQAGRKQGAGLRRVLVIFQFAVSIFLMAGTGIVLNQLSFMRSHDKGFDDSKVLVLSSLSARELADARIFKNESLGLAAVENVTMSNAVPGRETIAYSFRVPSMEENEWKVIPVLFTDADFQEVFDVELAAGRDFSWEFGADSTGSIILNEAAVQSFGWEPREAIGREFSLTRGSSTIVGVVKDFNYTSLHKSVEPMALVSNPTAYGSAPLLISIRLSKADIGRTISELRSVWMKMLPSRPFEYFFLDEDYDRQYRAEERLANIFTAFGGLAILIACLGLFGLATLAAEQKTKEIGIRKTLGASVWGIVGMFTADFMKLVAIAIVIGIPLTWFAAEKWLDGFAYRAGIGIGVFLISTLLLGLIASATITIQSVRVASANPVDALRHE